MIQYIKGNATSPLMKDDELNVILHIVNNVQAWGAGFVLALSQKWEAPEREFRKEKLNLGDCQHIAVDTDLMVVNMCAQHDIGFLLLNGKNRERKIPNCQYDILWECLKQVRSLYECETRFHFPLIGAGLGGANWEIISNMLTSVLGDSDLFCYIYDDKTWENYSHFHNSHLEKSEETF